MINERKTIGLLIGNTDDYFSKGIALGAIAAAEELDVNLIVTPGRYYGLAADFFPDSPYEYQFNTLFKHLTADNVDLIAICVGTIAYTLDEEKKKELLSEYGDVPIISIAEEVEGYSYVKFNNYSGISEAVDYLVNEQGKRRIGMLAGLQSNKDSAERFEAYKIGLEKNGLDFVDDRVVFADISRRCESGIIELFEKSKGDLDAILCSNDEMAGTLIKYMQKHGIEVGKDIAVVGFDNIPYAAKLDPPLASINASAVELGYLAIKKGCDMLLNGEENISSTVDTRFIPRQSSGSLNPELERISKIFERGNAEDFSKVTAELKLLLSDANATHSRLRIVTDAVNGILDVLYSKFLTDNATSDDVATIEEIFDKALQEDVDYQLVTEKMRTVFDVGFEWFSSRMKTHENALLLDKAYANIYRRISADVDKTFSGVLVNTLMLNHRINVVIRDMLMFENTYETSYASTLKKMSYLGAKSSYIYTFPKPVIYRRGTEWKCPSKWLLRAYQIDRDVFPVPHGQQELDSSEIFRHKYFPHDRRTTYIMAPLFSNDCQYGMFLCELPCENYCYFELLTYQLSAAVKMIELLKQQEDSLNRLNEDNAELDNISKLDELTGLLNRRGFNKKAREALQAYSGTNKHAVIAYADMDNLKIINDKYGHNEGDYSLKALAGVLKRTFRCSDIVGRVGGDEFVAMAITDDKDFSGIIQERFRKYIDDINADSGKPYSINMSMGIYDFNCNDKLALDEAVDKADDLLYEAKKKRIKLIK